MTCDKCEELEETVKQLRAAIRRRRTFSPVLGLTPAESRAAAVLLKRGQCSNELLAAVMCNSESTNPAASVKVLVARMRRKLEQHDIELKHRRWHGYYLDDDAKAALGRFMVRA